MPGGSDEGAPIDCERDQFQLREHQKHSMGQSARISDIGAVLGLFFADEKRKALATHTAGRMGSYTSLSFTTGLTHTCPRRASGFTFL